MKKALVTGGGGLVGLAIVRQLVAKGIQTAVLDKDADAEPRIPEVVDFHQGDIRDEKKLTEVSQGCDVVFHTAARKGLWGSWEKYHSVNVEGTRNVIGACRTNGVKCLIHTSTASVVFTGHDTCGVNERSPYASRFKSPYAHTKMLAEKLVLEANSEGLKTTALRPHLVWGPRDTDLIPRLVKRGAFGKLKRIGDGRNLVDITYVDNVATAHLLAAENLENSGRAAGEAYFISQGEPVFFWNWVNRLLRQLGVSPVEKTISFRKAYWTGLFLECLHKVSPSRREPWMTRFLAEQLARSQWYSIDKAVRDLKYQPSISIAEGLNRTVEWIIRGE